MSLEKRNFINEILIVNKCELCGNTGKIIIYRSDLEEFEEVECYLCTKKG
ncbi:MAG: hypothetical protein ACFE9I_16210 [Candidatus Hermodarchaeota archaeon]